MPSLSQPNETSHQRDRQNKAQRLVIQSINDDPRKHAGIELAATKAITQAGNVWLVPSQSGKEVYRARLDALPAVAVPIAWLARSSASISGLRRW